MSTALRAALPLILALSIGTAAAQPISLPGGTYSQDFDTLSNVAGSTTNSTLPAGWLLNETGGGARDNEQYAVDTGASNSGDTYSYGAAGSTERALGSLRSGTLIATYGACFTNNTGGAITAIDIGYTGEQWRLGTAARTDTLAFEYSTDATSLTTGTWTAHAPLNFTTPNTATTGAKDGNAAANRTALSSTVNASVANGAGFCLRWSDLDASGADDGLAIDDVSVTVGAAAPAPDFSASISASASAVSAGELFDVRSTLRNVGQVDLVNVPVTLSYPSGVVRGLIAYRNEVGNPRLDCSVVNETIECLVDLPAGASADVLVDDYQVEPSAVSPLVFTVSGSPPSSDTNASNDSAEVSVNVLQEVAIHDIQGTGTGSPLAIGTEVLTEGIVTARRGNGYFIQSAPGDEDGDPATAEGLFVFTGGTPPVDAAVGNRLRIGGRVTSFSRTPHGYPLTQLGSSSFVVLSTGNPLPPAVLIDASVLSEGVALNAMGRYQGMRVELPAAVVVGPTNGFGDFYVTLPETVRPAREPGIAALDAVPLPPMNNIPVFDRNPERLRVESLGLEAGTALNVDAGTQLQGMAGVMYYDRGDFTLLLGNNSGILASGGAFVSAVPVAGAGAVRIGSYNIENFALTGDFITRLDKLSEVFCQYLRNPDVVGLVEIANQAAADRLASAINTNEFGTCPDSPQYQAYVLSNSGSQRLGFLVKTAPVGAGGPRVAVDTITEMFTAELLVAPDMSTNSGALFDRAPLLLNAIVAGENGQEFRLNVLLNHTLSLLDVNSLSTRADAWLTSGNRSRGKRLQQAVMLSELVEATQTGPTPANLVLIGDYNAFDFSDGYVDVMGIIGGTPAPADQVLVHGASAVSRPLVNLLGTKPEAERYSYVFEGNIQSLDHALVNDTVLENTEARLFHARVNSDFATDNAADPTVPVRTSDHDPLVAELRVGRFLNADLAVLVDSPRKPVPSGGIARFDLTVANLQNDDALRTALRVNVESLPSRVRIFPMAGWTCDAPVAIDTGAELACRRDAAMPRGAMERFRLEVDAVRLGAIQELGVEATVTTISRDLDPDSNTGTGSVRIVGQPQNAFNR